MIEVPADSPRWSEFVRLRRDALVFHDPAWVQLLAECYGFRAFALLLTDPADTVIGGLPMIEVAGRVHKPRWVSLPFTDICPPLVDPDTAGMLVESLETMRKEAGVTAVEIHADVPSDLVERTRLSLTHTLTLDQDPDIVRSRFRASVRRNMRKAERSGVTVTVGESESDLTEIFYALHLQTRRRLGVPIQPRRFFRLLWQRMLAEQRGFLLLAHHQGIPVAGAVFLAANRTVLYKYGASDAAYWQLRPNDLLFATAIRLACEQGYEAFDFGRTDPESSTLRRFKLGWGSTENVFSYTRIGEQGSGSRLGAWKLGRPVIRHSPPWVGRVIGELLYHRAA